ITGVVQHCSRQIDGLMTTHGPEPPTPTATVASSSSTLTVSGAPGVITSGRSYGANPAARTASLYVPGGTSPWVPRNGCPLRVTRAPAGTPCRVSLPGVPGATGPRVSTGGGDVVAAVSAAPASPASPSRRCATVSWMAAATESGTAARAKKSKPFFYPDSPEQGTLVVGFEGRQRDHLHDGLVADGEGVLAVERHAAGEALVGDDAERVDVAAAVERLRARLLGAHVVGRADRHARAGEL